MNDTVFSLEEGDVRYEVKEAGLIRRIMSLSPSGYLERLEVGEEVVERPDSGVTLSFSTSALQNIGYLVDKAVEENESLEEYGEELEDFKERYGHIVPGVIVNRYEEAKDSGEELDIDPEIPT